MPFPGELHLAKGLRPANSGGSPAPYLFSRYPLHQRGAARYYQSQRGMMNVPRNVMSMHRIPKSRKGTERTGAMKQAWNANRHLNMLLRMIWLKRHQQLVSCGGVVLPGDVGRQRLRSKRAAIAGDRDSQTILTIPHIESLLLGPSG